MISKNRERTGVNAPQTLEQRWQAIWESGRQPQLLEGIRAVFTGAIEARAPRNRPPGKAGLRAEKGYYRLLYLEDLFSTRAFGSEDADPHARELSWEKIEEILEQLKDIPELQEEIRVGIESAMDASENRNRH